MRNSNQPPRGRRHGRATLTPMIQPILDGLQPPCPVCNTPLDSIEGSFGLGLDDLIKCRPCGCSYRYRTSRGDYLQPIRGTEWCPARDTPR